MEQFPDRSIRTRRRARGWPWAATVLTAILFTVQARADYIFEALGTFGELASEPAAINDAGRVTGTLTGT